jgi:hypothetical protein
MTARRRRRRRRSTSPYLVSKNPYACAGAREKKKPALV